MNRPNETIRECAEKNGVKLWEIAEQFGVTDTTFSKKMRHEFTPEENKRAMQAIKQIAAKKKAG
jgi:hypothetical protein